MSRTPDGSAYRTAPESTEKEETREDWWEVCPVCGWRLHNHKCRFVCSNPQCHFFMSCSEFDM